jgi:hypothetical protein
MLPPKLNEIKSMLADASQLTSHQAELSSELKHLDDHNDFQRIVGQYLDRKSLGAAPTRVSPAPSSCPCCGRSFP